MYNSDSVMYNYMPLYTCSRQECSYNIDYKQQLYKRNKLEYTHNKLLYIDNIECIQGVCNCNMQVNSNKYNNLSLILYNDTDSLL